MESILLGYTHNGKTVLIAGPEVPHSDQYDAYIELTKDRGVHGKFCKVRLCDLDNSDLFGELTFTTEKQAQENAERKESLEADIAKNKVDSAARQKQQADAVQAEKDSAHKSQVAALDKRVKAIVTSLKTGITA